MKTRLFFFIPLMLLVLVSYSQTYKFSKLVKKANVQTSTGNEFKVISTAEGPFQIVFKPQTDLQNRMSFRILNPGQTQETGAPWFGQLRDIGYVEKDSTLFKKCLYFEEETMQSILVLIAEDYSKIVIFKSDRSIWEYIK